MKRAIVLNAGFSWSAYQVGVLRHLISDRALHFDLFAGSGLGALNAALAACGQLDALEELWRRGPRRLLRLNLASLPQGVLSNARLRDFIEQHVRPDQLRANRSQLIVNVFNLQTGREELHRYPGAELPLVDAVLAATSSAGLEPGVLHHSKRLFDGTFVSGFLAEEVASLPVPEIYAVAACLPVDHGAPRRYETWPAILNRALEMNQMHDVRQGLKDARTASDTATSFVRVRTLMHRLGELTDNQEEAAALHTRLAAITERSPLVKNRSAVGSELKLFAPSRHLDYPMWRFKKSDLERARQLGHSDARAAFGEVSEPRVAAAVVTLNKHQVRL